MIRCKVLTLLFFLSLACSITTGQEKLINIPLRDAKTIQESKGTAILILSPTEVWANDEKADSILWTVKMEVSEKPLDSLKYTLQDQSLEIMTERTHQDSIRLRISKERNPFIENDIVLNYSINSLKNWTLKTIPEGSLEKIKLNLTLLDQENGQSLLIPWESFLIPFSVGMTYDDVRLNEMPLSIKTGFNKVGRLGEDIIYLSKEKWLSDDSSIGFIVYANGQTPHRNQLIDNVIYKNKYRLHDTVMIDKQWLRIDSIDSTMSNLQLSTVDKPNSGHFLPTELRDQLLKYFDESSDYLVIDFWGSWCAPCIEAMPEAKAIYEQVQGNTSFLGVCMDQTADFDVAKKIVEKEEISWPQMYVDMDNQEGSIISKLEVSTYPTYMLIDKEGRIIHRNSSGGLLEIKQILLGE